LSEFVDMEGFAFFSQYLNAHVNQGLTPSSTPSHGSRFGIRLSPKLAYSTQLIVKLKFKDLKKDFLDILFFHGSTSWMIVNINQYIFSITSQLTYIYQAQKERINKATAGTYGKKS